MARVEISRLREIEEKAKSVRLAAVEALRVLGVELTLQTDLRHLATVLTMGTVKAVPNLTFAGTRLAGCLEWLLVGANIFFEAYDPRARQRFSMAHELGHFYLHVQLLRRPNRVHADPSRSNEDEAMLPIWEQEADAFAAALLMPAADLRADRITYGPALSFLAERYGVSEIAMKYRLQTLEELCP